MEFTDCIPMAVKYTCIPCIFCISISRSENLYLVQILSVGRNNLQLVACVLHQKVHGIWSSLFVMLATTENHFLDLLIKLQTGDILIWLFPLIYYLLYKQKLSLINNLDTMQYRSHKKVRINAWFFLTFLNKFSN